MRFLRTIHYIFRISIAAFVLGRVYPRRWISADHFPFKSFKFENGGRIYNRINIMKWKTKLPDASMLITKLIPKFMPKKRLDQSEQIPILIKETCVAETTHVLVSILGFGCVFLLEGIGGWLISVAFLLINLPFIIIQRFNRPRLIAAQTMMRRSDPKCVTNAISEA